MMGQEDKMGCSLPIIPTLTTKMEPWFPLIILAPCGGPDPVHLALGLIVSNRHDEYTSLSLGMKQYACLTTILIKWTDAEVKVGQSSCWEKDIKYDERTRIIRVSGMSMRKNTRMICTLKEVPLTYKTFQNHQE